MTQEQQRALTPEEIQEMEAAARHAKEVKE